MPYLIGDGSTTKPTTKMLIGNGAGGTVPIKKIVSGTGSSTVEVWPGKKKFFDNFDRADQTLSTSADWNVIAQENPYVLWVVGNNVRVYNDGTDGLRSSWCNWNDKCQTDVQYSKGKIVEIGNSSRGTWVLLHGNAGLTNSMGFQWTGSSLQLFSTIGTVTAVRGPSATKTQVVGDTMEIRAYRNSSNQWVYEGWVNNLVYCTWTDTTNVIARGTSNRYVGFGMQRNRAFFNSTFSTQFSEWEGGDY
ncbi:hypothetical protein ACFVWF_32290 [Rhodococcus qingshengii]|uniref:hypothetical protein n=1 Tax=Rhodococcus qingshengii TaxID=334542 RepID=UPI0036DE40C5